MADRRSKPPALVQERYLLGVATDAERARVEAAFSPEELASLHAAHEADAAELLVRRSPEAFGRSVRARETEAQHGGAATPLRGLAMAGLLAAALLVGRSVLLQHDGQLAGDSSETGASFDVRAKGQRPVLHVYRQSDRGAQRLKDGSAVEAGDVVQLGYVAAGQTYGVVLSIDGRGAVTLHSPHESDGDTRLAVDAGKHLLDTAYELDDAPDFERFFFVTSMAPISAAEVVAAARAQARDPEARERASLELPTGLEQTSLVLRKESD